MPEHTEDTEDTSPGSRAARLLPVVIPAAVLPVLGEWHGRGLCAGAEPEAFFPSHGDPGSEARRICAACLVRDECLSYATAADESGIWGGLDQQERRNRKRRQQRSNAAARARGSSIGGAA